MEYTEKMLLENVFRILNDSGLDYCVQNKYEMMPEKIPSDIDMMYRNASEADLDRIIKKIASDTNLLVTQKIVQDYGEFTYILSYPVPNKRFQLQLDFYKVISKGKIRNALLADDMLERKRFYKIFYVPEKYDEMRYIIVRRTLKKDVNEEHIEELCRLYEGQDECLEKDFGSELTEHILDMIKRKDTTVFYQNYHKFFDVILRMSKKNYGMQERVKFFTFIIKNYPTKRIAHTCGLSVAFLAPDGTGKSTLIETIKETCSGSFYGVDYNYFRPRVLKNIGHYNKLHPTEEAKSNENPHNVILNGKLKSWVRFMFYNLDFLIGMNTKIRIKKMKKMLVIFDRFYYDYYADMKRYQYKLKSRTARMFRFMIPNPDLVVILDADATKVRERKKELTIEEIEKQRAGFRNVVRDIKNAVIVDANGTAEVVASEVTRLILGEQSKRTMKIMK